MKGLLRALKRVWILNAVRRMFQATKSFNFRYAQIFRWVFTSNEDTNFTYLLTDENLIYLAQTIAVVTQKPYAEIAGYIQEAESNEALKNHILAITQASDQRFFADQEVRFGRRLGWYAFVRANKPKVVIETGVDKGLGGVLLCAALEKNLAEGHPGKYYGTDINPEAGYLIAGPYSAFGQVLYGDSIESLLQFTASIDLFINDSDHSADYEYREYQTILPKLNEKAIILGDNAHYTNKLSRFSLEQDRKFLFFKEQPLHHWYPGAGIGISYC